MDVEDRCRHGTFFARQGHLLLAARVGTVFNVTHECKAGAAARAELENHGSIRVSIGSRDGLAADNEQEGNEATNSLSDHGFLVFLSARPDPGRATAVETTCPKDQARRGEDARNAGPFGIKEVTGLQLRLIL